MADKILSQSAYTAVINAPIEWVDIADWLLNLPDAEYQRCAPPDHIAAGYTTSDDGRPMSINVEQIGTGLVIQHYIGEVTEKHHCRMVSHSDVYTPHGRTKVQVIWDLSVKPIDAEHCEYTNGVLGLTNELSALITHIAFYAGFPAAISASAIAAKTLTQPTRPDGHPVASDSSQ